MQSDGFRTVMKSSTQLKLKKPMGCSYIRKKPEDQSTRLTARIGASERLSQVAQEKVSKEIIMKDLAEVGAATEFGLDRSEDNVSQKHRNLRLPRIKTPTRNRNYKCRLTAVFNIGIATRISESQFLSGMLHTLHFYGISWRAICMRT